MGDFDDLRRFADGEMQPEFAAPRLVRMRCHMHSAPGMWAAYDGHVDVIAPHDASEAEVFSRAVKVLAQTSFPDRPSLSSWRLDRVEVLRA